MTMRIGSLFSGYGGLDMGVQAAIGGTVAWHCEYEPPSKANPRPSQAAARILAHHWPGVPNLGDITTVDWDAVPPVDVLTGGFPCQDISVAGKQAGIRPGTRSGLWTHMAYAIDQLRPRLVVIENVRGLLSASAHSDLERDCWCVGDDREPALRALGAVLGDLADLGYDAEWTGVRAADAGAPHGRFRVFIVAHPAGDTRRIGDGDGGDAAYADLAGLEGRPADRRGAGEQPARSDGVGAELVGVSKSPMAGDAKAARNSTATRHRIPPTGIHAGGGRAPGTGDISGTWGPYASAILRWEMVTGRVAPPPTEPGKDGRPRLSALAVEFMMGLPAGWVTDPAIGLTRAQALKCLGNGVVMQQAALALLLLDALTGPR